MHNNNNDNLGKKKDNLDTKQENNNTEEDSNSSDDNIIIPTTSLRVIKEDSDWLPLILEAASRTINKSTELLSQTHSKETDKQNQKLLKLKSEKHQSYVFRESTQEGLITNIQKSEAKIRISAFSNKVAESIKTLLKVKIHLRTTINMKQSQKILDIQQVSSQSTYDKHR